MTRDEILEKIVAIIHEALPETKKEALTMDTVVNRDVGLDSMNFIMIICRIEGEFGIRIPDRKWMKLQTLGEVVAAVEGQLARKR